MLLLAPTAPRTKSPVGVYGKPDGRTVWRYRNNGNMKGKSLIRAWKSLEEGSEAMGIDWMGVDGLREAIPPVDKHRAASANNSWRIYAPRLHADLKRGRRWV